VTRAACLSLLIALAAPAVAQQPPPALPDAPHVLAFLNRTISWRNGIDAQAALADQPTDVLYVNDDRNLARQVVALSFESAKAVAQMETASSPAAPAAASDRFQRLNKRATSAADLLRREQARLADLQRQLANASAGDRARLDAAVAEAQSRVAIAQARNDAVSGIVGFANAGNGSGDLLSQINALEQTVNASTATPVASAARRTPPSSIVGLIGDLLALNQKDHALEAAIRSAGVLQRDARAFMTPLMSLMTDTRQRTDALMNAPDTSDPAELLRRKSELDAMYARYRGLSAAVTPLAKRRILLDAYGQNFGRWRSSVIEQYRDELRRLIIRAVVLGVVLFLVVLMAAIWRRVTFRYVADVKRRHHFLLIRRIVLMLVVAAILTVTFASDFSSLTTFFGLLTAGIAIALQDVILSMAGYFVIIGKYGIRVGDRVRIAAVNGDVLDIGLVWIYLMELETRGSDQFPTGRIVEFPNSVVFDHSAGIFKQLPGTRFLWHEVSLTVLAGADFRDAQAKLLAAVESVFDEYRPAIEQQHRDMDRLLGMTTPTPRPHTRLRVGTAGMEIRVRYPVEIERAGEIDDRVAAAVAANRIEE
jgi:small-conductance mechanosensitive channel